MLEKFTNKIAEILSEESLELGFKVILLGFMNFFTFIFAGLVYFIPIDLTWRTIGQFPAILLGAFCLFVYSCVFALVLIKGTERINK